MTRLARLAPLALLLGAAAPDGSAPTLADYAADARDLAPLIAANYAYLDDLPGAAVPTSPVLIAERDAVRDRDTLLRYAGDMLTALADHHAMTGRSFADDWAIVPSYADLWVVRRGAGYAIDAVKPGSPAAAARVRAGQSLAAVDGVPTAQAVAAFWARLGLAPVGERGAFAARVLAAGRRDRVRTLTIGGRTLTLPNLYVDRPDRPPVTVVQHGGATVIRFGNALGDAATIGAFDAAMARLAPGARVVLDLTDTPSGGNTSVARAIMGWFVVRAMPYQMHNAPAEQRETGIARQWVEQVLPRAGKHHAGPVRVRVGRWTGSVGEGLAVGFDAIGVPVCGTPMAGLKGAVSDFDLPRTRLRIKFPTERLSTVGGVARERFVPRRCSNGTDAGE